ncbi:MAG: UvrD-helicase domain-containing protein [Candidatus Eisenbacteria bacterium]|nr:UvrD-helicase domain-containing protein [Candidatus Eisenbacteria bacterium]
MPDAGKTRAERERMTAAQQAIIGAAERVVWVSAAAGSGKTRCLVERLAGLLESSPAEAERSVAFTFTRKAAQEMTHRLRERMTRAGSREATRAVDRLSIGTIDSFCVQTLREHAVDLGLDPRFEVLDPVEGDQLEREVARAVLEGVAGRIAAAMPIPSAAAAAPTASAAAASPAPSTTSPAAAASLQEWFTRFEVDTLAGVLIEAARRLCTAGDPEALLDEWEAGPGRDLESYMRDLEPRKVTLQHRALDAVRGSLTVAAADGTRTDAERDTIRDCIRRLGGPAWDLQAWTDAHAALKQHGAAADKARFEGVRQAAWDFTKLDQSPWKEFRKPEGLADAEIFRLLKVMIPVLREHLRAFGRAKREMIPPRLDFQDVLLGVMRLGEASANFRAFRDRRLGRLLVDELQDVNGLQSRLIEELGRSGEVFGVGDPMQSIYRFRHADVELFAKRLAGTDAGSTSKGYRLHENHRSVRGVMDFVNAVFPWLVRVADAGGGGAEFDRVEARRDEPSVPAPPVEWIVVRKPARGAGRGAETPGLAEARRVAARLLELREGGTQVPQRDPESGEFTSRPMKWSDIAVLSRAKSAIPVYAKAFADAGIPVETQFQAGLLDSVEGRDVVALLQVLRNPIQDLPLAGVLRSPFVGLRDESLLGLAEAASRCTARGEERPPLIGMLRDPEIAGALDSGDTGRVREFLDRLDDTRGRILLEGAPVILREWLDGTGYLAREAPRRDGDQVAANLGALLQQCRSLEPSRGDLAGLLERLRHLADTENGPRESAVGSGRGVQLATIHSAKGLEFPIVVVAGLGRRWKTHGRDPKALTLRFDGPDRRLALAARMGASLGSDAALKGWAPYLLHAAEDHDDRLEEVRLLYVAATRARERLILAGTQLVSASSGATWPDGYGRWLDDALRSAEAAGQPVGTLLSRDEVDASDVTRPKPSSRALASLWQAHSDPIRAGAPIPVAADSALDARAQEILERVARPAPAPELVPRDVGAADMGTALRCPWLLRFRPFVDEVQGRSARGAGEAGGAASERGQRVHAFFEHWDVRVSPKEDFDRAAGLAQLTPEDRRDLAQWLENPDVAAALGELTGAPERVMRELVLEWSVLRSRISGRLDALVRLSDGAWRVVDFKTDKGDDLAETYDRQTAIYAAAVERAGMGRVAGRRLIYLRRGVVEDLPWNPGDADVLERRIEAALLALGREEEMARPGCAECLKKLEGNRAFRCMS